MRRLARSATGSWVDSAALTAIVLFSSLMKLIKTLSVKGNAGEMLLSRAEYGKQWQAIDARRGDWRIIT
jgi:hypothetical protein